MKRMTRFVSLILCMILILSSFAGCSVFGSSDKKGNSSNSGYTSKSESTSGSSDKKGNSSGNGYSSNSGTISGGDSTASVFNYAATQRDEDPYKWDGMSEKYVTFEFSEGFKQAIATNLDKNIVVNVSVDLSCDKDWEFQSISLKTLKSGGETYSLGKDLTLKGGTYKTFSYTATVPAKLLQSGNIYVCLKGLDANVLNLAYYYYKNVSISASFENG